MTTPRTSSLSPDVLAARLHPQRGANNRPHVVDWTPEVPPAPVSARVRSLRVVTRHAIALGNVCLVLTIGLVMLATLPALFGFHPVTIYGGSMGESLPKGSVAVMQSVDSREIAPGDVIAVQDGDGLPVIHRVTQIEEAATGRVATLKGDANQVPDANEVTLTGEGDRLVYYVPLVGFLLAFVLTPPGLAILLGAMLFGPAWNFVARHRPGHLELRRRRCA